MPDPTPTEAALDTLRETELTVAQQLTVATAHFLAEIEVMAAALPQISHLDIPTMEMIKSIRSMVDHIAANRLPNRILVLTGAPASGEAPMSEPAPTPGPL